MSLNIKFISFLSVSDIKEFIKGSALTALGVKGVGMLITLIGIRLLLDHVGVEGYGRFSIYLSAIMLIVGFSQLGIPQILVKNVARYLLAEQFSHIKGAGFYGYLLTAIASIVLALLFFVLFPMVDSLSELDSLYLFILSLSTVILVTNKIRFSLIRAVGWGAVSEAPELLVRPFVMYASLIVLYMFSQDLVLASIWALLLSAVLSALFGRFIYNLSNRKTSSITTNELNISDWIPQIALGLLASTCLAIREHGGVLIASGFLADDELGIFRVTQQLMRVAIIGSMAVNLSQAPKIARYWVTKDFEKIRRQLARGFEFALTVPILIVTVGFVVQFVFGQDILTILLGDESNKLELYMLCMVVPAIIYICTGPTTQILVAVNQEKLLAFIAVTHCVLYVLAIYISMTLYGFEGLVYSFAIVNSVINVFSSLLLYKVSKIEPSLFVVCKKYLRIIYTR